MKFKSPEGNIVTAHTPADAVNLRARGYEEVEAAKEQPQPRRAKSTTSEK